MAASPVFACIGCGVRRVPAKWTYCDTCRRRLDRGEQVEQDDFPSVQEAWAAVGWAVQPRKPPRRA